MTRPSPMESMNLDFCQLGNGYYIIWVYRCSGMIVTKKVDRQTTVEAIKFVKHIWNTHGVSREVRSDRGPAFRDQFLDDLENMGVDVVHSSPYHPQGNGLAEQQSKR